MSSEKDTTWAKLVLPTGKSKMTPRISYPSEALIELSLFRIFAICDHVAKSLNPIRTESQGKETARIFLGLPISGVEQKVKPKEIKQ